MVVAVHTHVTSVASKANFLFNGYQGALLPNIVHLPTLIIMKRRYFITLAAASLSALGTGWLSAAIAQSKPKSIKPYPAKTDDEQAIVKLAQSRDKKGEKTVVTRLAIADGYGLYSWVVGESGGQTLVRKDVKGDWKIIRGSGGMFDAELLVKRFKVPEATAKALVQAIADQIKADKP